MTKSIIAVLALAASSWAADSDCVDSADWGHKNRMDENGMALGCDWVAMDKREDKPRCNVNGEVNGVLVKAKDACIATCGGCEDNSDARSSVSEMINTMCPFLVNTFEVPGKVPCDKAFEQSPADLTVGKVGTLGPNLPADPTRYADIDKCAVNVHWHLGAEHRNEGTFDIPGDQFIEQYGANRRLAGDVTPGYFCQGYDENDPKYTTEYDWQWCENMHVGYTYEVHWPHSNGGPCGLMTDGLGGLFCTQMPTKAGVEGQVFVVVNDDSGKYDEPRLIHHMVGDIETMDIAKYTGSSTGTSHNNEVCSPYNVQWHVDRACNLVSARSFDEMCKTMYEVYGMTKDLYPHGSRVLVDPQWVTNQPMKRKLRGSPATEEKEMTGGWH